jgi:uncharacterized protein YegL
MTPEKIIEKKRPGGALATRPLHFIWMTDCSGSMTGDKIQSLNHAIREAIPAMRAVAHDNPYANVLIRAVKFSDGAQWHVETPTPVNEFKWEDLDAGGLTDMGKAIALVTEQMTMPLMSDRALPPVLVLISDGQPTDDFDEALADLLALPWGTKAVRVGIAIGEDADHAVLQKFINNPDLKPLQANNAEQLVRYIRWVSTAVLKSASAPASQASLAITGNVPLPPLPMVTLADIPDVADVW